MEAYMMQDKQQLFIGGYAENSTHSFYFISSDYNPFQIVHCIEMQQSFPC
jgi:hypothetical protein